MSVLKGVLRACLASLLCVSISPVFAEYPDRPVSVIVPFAVGGPTDSLARIVTASMEKQSGVPFVVENVAGAGSTIGTAKVASAEPDGYTLLWGSSTAMVIAPHLYKQLRYDPFKSFEPIGRVASTPYVIIVNEKSPFQSYGDLVDYGKRNPGKLNFGTPGAGTSLHLTVELMMGESGFSAVHVPYKGGSPALMALMAGDLDFVIDVPNTTLPMLEAGRVRPLAVTSQSRLPELPDVPTLNELGLDGFESISWFAMFAPSGTPQAALEKIRTLLRHALEDPSVREVLKNIGFTAEDSRSEVLRRVIEVENARWGEVIREKNISLN